MIITLAMSIKCPHQNFRQLAKFALELTTSETDDVDVDNDDDCPRKPAIVIANMIVRAICKTKARNRPFILYHKIGEL